MGLNAYILSMSHVIYCFVFPNKKRYIGQTINFNSRMSNHRKVAKERKFKTPLYNAINKYGWDNVIIEKLIICGSDDVDELERLYIQKFKSLNRKYGYNLDTGGVLNKKHSRTTRQKISDTNQSKSKHTFRTRVKRVCAYTPEGEFVGIYESASEAARVHGVAANTIARVCRGGRKTSCGLVWKWAEV